MEFDFKETFSNMFGAAKDSAEGEWKNSKELVNQFLEFNKSHMELIAGQFIRGEIDKAKFEYRLKELKENFELQALALKLAAKIAAQNAVNAAIGVFEKAVFAALGL
jgi:hypothetical protein